MDSKPLDRELSGEPDFEYASTGQRVLNFIIDMLLLWFVFQGNALLWVETVIAWVVPETINTMDEISIVESKVTLILSLFNIAILVFYYSLFEYFSGGKTIGKLFTRTHALREDFTRLTYKDALLRSVCRLIPFEPFSFLGGSNGWHDTITGTTVYQDK
jgi:uncharacterized RDD family membrane protein YckC